MYIRHVLFLIVFLKIIFFKQHKQVKFQEVKS